MAVLSRRELRAWRRIVRSLREDDPEWVALFDDRDTARRVSGMRVGAAFLAMALSLVMFGLAVGSMQMVFAGVLVLGGLPLLVLLVLAAGRDQPPGRTGGLD